MKNFSKLLFVVSAGMIVCVVPAYSASAYDTDTVFTTDYLRVREAPGLDANIVDVAAPGTAVEQITVLDSGWSKVFYDGGVYYMHSDYLTDAAEEDDVYEEDTADVFNSDYDADSYVDDIIAASDFYFDGVEFWGDYRWTYYSEQVLPGGGLDIPGRHTDENGYVCDAYDNICLASDFLEKGTVVATPFGKNGRVYDCGCGDNITLDVYVNW